MRSLVEGGMEEVVVVGGASSMGGRMGAETERWGREGGCGGVMLRRGGAGGAKPNRGCEGRRRGTTTAGVDVGEG